VSVDIESYASRAGLPVPGARTARFLRRAFLPTSILALIALIYVVSRTLGVVAAVKGSYALLGLLVTALLYYGFGLGTGRRDAEPGPLDDARVAGALLAAAVVVVVASTLVVAPAVIDGAVGTVVAFAMRYPLTPAGVAAGLADLVAFLVGDYALLAVSLPFTLAVAAGLYARFGAVESPARDADLARAYGKGVLTLAALAVGLSAFTGERVTALVLIVPLAYALLALQLFGASPRWLGLQATALFAISPVTKYLTTGFYFGAGDNLFHVRYVRELIATGGTAVLGRYADFPGLHAVTGALSFAGDLPVYDAMLGTGILLYVGLVPLVYLLVVLTTDQPRLGAFAAVGLVAMDQVGYHATYFFPQAFGVVEVLFVLYLTFRLNTLERWADRVAATSLVALIFAAMVLTHHLTFVLIAPMLAMLVLAPVVVRRLYGEGVGLAAPRTVPLVVGGVLATAYWTFRSEFLAEFVTSFLVLFGSQVVASSGSKPIAAYGVDTLVPPATPATAVRSLVSPDGLHLIVLVAVFSLGGLALLAEPRRYRGAAALALGGILAAFVVFRTPIALTDIERFRLPLSFFFVVVLGVGLAAAFERSAVSTSRVVVLVTVLVLLGTATPLAAGDDLYQVNEGPNLYELFPTAEPEADLEWNEYRQLEATTAFTARYEGSVTTPWVEKEVMARHFGPVGVRHLGVTDPAAAEQGLTAERGLVVHRDAWRRHSLILNPGGLTSLSELTVSDEWVTRTEATENEVYSAGSVRLLWQESDGRVGEFDHTVHRAT
jgi:hypothetical protein